MGLLSWLGLQKEDTYPNLDLLLRELKRALPTDEQVVLRYIAIVIVLLGRVAVADGRFTDKEDQSLHKLLTGVGRISQASVDAVCAALRGNMPQVSDEEVALCYRELKSICDARERIEVIRLLMELAAVDGDACTSENNEIERIARELGVSFQDVVNAKPQAN